MPHIFSTLTANNIYQDWTDVGGMQQAGRKVLIRGGANVADKHFITPMGVPTEVTDEELAFLETHEGFLNHKKLGFVSVQKKKADVEAVVQDMTKKDKSAPLTDADFEGKTGAKPSKKSKASDSE